MTVYTPLRGDIVKVAGDDGEWTVLGGGYRGRVVIRAEDTLLTVLPSMLTPVAPPLPPEPPVGSVVFVDGEPWLRRDNGYWMTGTGHARWLEIADHAVLAVNPADDESVRAAGLCRVEDVARWLYDGPLFVNEAVKERAERQFRERFAPEATK